MAQNDVQNFVKCHEAIHAVCSSTLPYLQNTIETWHTRRQQYLQPCQSLNGCPANKKPTPSKSSHCIACVNWGQAIEGACFPPEKAVFIPWKNIKPSLLHKDPVEVAKAFVFILPHDQDIKEFGDFDVGSILKMMIGFEEFHRGDKDTCDAIEKVASVRNTLCHFKLQNRMYLNEQLTDSYFTDLVNLVDCLKRIRQLSTTDADEIRSQLTEIRNSDVTSNMEERAFHPITAAVKEELQALSAIYNEADRRVLNQTQALTKECVATIRCETKRQGRELQHALTDTLNKSRMKDNTYGESILAAFDVEACAGEIAQLYEKENCQVPFLPNDYYGMVLIDEIFVDLQLVEDNKSREKVTLKSFSDLFEMRTSSGHKEHRLLLRAGPGGGKSTLTSKIAHDWTKLRNPGSSCSEEMTALGEFKLVFALKMRELQPDMSLVDAVFDQLLPFDTNIDRTALEMYIQSNPEQILVILDGLDEIKGNIHSSSLRRSLSDVICNKILRNTTVIVTTRPQGIAKLGRFQSYYAHVEMTGFSKVNVQKYVDKFFQLYGCRSHGTGKAQTLLEEIQNSEQLANISSVPIILTMLCILWDDDIKLSGKVTQLYQDLIMCLVKHSKAKYMTESGDEDDDDDEEKENQLRVEVSNLMAGLGCSALQGLLEDRLLFTTADFSKAATDIEDACRVGLITKERKRSKLSIVQHITFLHKTFQEVCAAQYLVTLAIRNDEFSNCLKRINRENVDEFEYFLRFSCGMSIVAAHKILQHVVNLFHDVLMTPEGLCRIQFGHAYKFDGVGPWRLPLLLLFEGQSSDLIKWMTPLSECLKLELVDIHNSEILAALSYLSRNIARIFAAEDIHVTELSLDNSALDVDSFLGLLSQVLNLTVLEIQNTNNVLLDRDLGKFLNALRSNSIERLIFKSVDLSQYVTTVETFIPNIRTIVFNNITMKKGHWELLLKMLKNAENLKELSLSENDLGCAVSVLEHESDSLPNLRVLDLASCGMNEASCRVIFVWILLTPALKKINMSGNVLGNAVRELGGAFSTIPLLETIQLCSVNFMQSHMKVLSEYLPRLRRLRTLDLHWSRVGNGMHDLSCALKDMDMLSELNLSRTDLVSENVVALCDALQNLNHLTYLDLSFNSIGDEGATVLAKVFQFLEQLQVLDVSKCSIGCNGAEAMAETLPFLTNLTSLCIADNAEWGPKGVELLFKDLTSLSAMRSLNMENIEVRHGKCSDILQMCFLQLGHTHCDIRSNHDIKIDNVSRNSSSLDDGSDNDCGDSGDRENILTTRQQQSQQDNDDNVFVEHAHSTLCQSFCRAICSICCCFCRRKTLQGKDSKYSAIPETNDDDAIQSTEMITRRNGITGTGLGVRIVCKIVEFECRRNPVDTMAEPFKGPLFNLGPICYRDWKLCFTTVFCYVQSLYRLLYYSKYTRNDIVEIFISSDPLA